MPPWRGRAARAGAARAPRAASRAASAAARRRPAKRVPPPRDGAGAAPGSEVGRRVAVPPAGRCALPRGWRSKRRGRFRAASSRPQGDFLEREREEEGQKQQAGGGEIGGGEGVAQHSARGREQGGTRPGGRVTGQRRSPQSF